MLTQPRRLMVLDLNVLLHAISSMELLFTQVADKMAIVTFANLFHLDFGA